jgi:hypothetical protein
MARTLRILSDPGDLSYAREQFHRIAHPDPERPSPAYWDREGNAYVPHDYESQESDFERFCTRARAQMRALGVEYDGRWLNEAWAAYWDGMALRKLRLVPAAAQNPN